MLLLPTQYNAYDYKDKELVGIWVYQHKLIDGWLFKKDMMLQVYNRIVGNYSDKNTYPILTREDILNIAPQ